MIMNLWLSPEIRSPYPGWVLDLIPVFNYSFQGGSNSCFFPHWILLGVFSLWGGWPLRSGWAFIAAQRTARSGSMRQLNRASAISGEKGGKLRKATRSWGGKRWDMVTWWKIMENVEIMAIKRIQIPGIGGQGLHQPKCCWVLTCVDSSNLTLRQQMEASSFKGVICPMRLQIHRLPKGH